MRYIKRSLSLQLVVTIVGALAVLLTLVAALLVNKESNNTRKQVDADISALVALKANEIGGYFVAKGQVIHSVFAEPGLIHWFSQYHARGSNLANDQQYQDIIRYFRSFSDRDSDVKSVFFGSANTFEYFDLNGRFDGDPNYYTNKRPWWQEAIDQRSLFVGDPAVDANDGSISATVKTPVYGANGELIGIGGMDILIDTIGKTLLAPIKYRNYGQAFLMTDEGKLVYFPGFSDKFPPGSLANQIDSQFKDTSGFTALRQQMQREAQGFAEVTFNGVPQRVTFVSVGGDYPKQKWHLAFMLPHEVIEAPVTEAFWNACFVALGIMLLVGITVWLMLLPFRRQLGKLLDAMEDIAEGDSDLSQRILMEREDELGKLGDAFNRFAEKVQQMLLHTRNLTQEVGTGVMDARQVCDLAVSSVSSQKQQIDSVATAATQMAQTSQEMAISAQRANDFAEKAQTQAHDGTQIVSRATEGMKALSVQVIEAAKVIKELRSRSEQIGEVLSVIRNIADQTNLLALNAAIEAARAGEQGRGFAVVADEVRTLASRTQDSTANIQGIIQTLQQSALQAEQVMESGVEQARVGQDLTTQVEQALSDIASAIVSIQQQTVEITVAIGQQAVVAEEVAQNVVSVRGLSDQSLLSSQDLSQSLQGFEQATHELTRNIGQFKI
ncbi:methyl-accepting chemotaxis protein [Shewanella seohaensis]|uniref:methyl-accepting chemotaxis protein n=1 Tax=Shewanella seohaensis TaxID=755175 RepID=UPI00201015C4|nr:methyl-accepting chemotaxis protein [Shewanella seohaensis]MCL1119052.1 methyl-accepting chemotaxis protein [Shewanella seohaensis]UXM81680.1 methyl-accepting chemotaxis protein [Shewanella seohaensis]